MEESSANEEMQWMDLETSKPEEQGPAKVRMIGAVAGKEREDKEQMMINLNNMKILAQLKQETRLLMSVCFWVALIPLQLAAPAIATVKAHAEKTRGISNHRLGPPHPQMWRSFIHTILTTVQGTMKGPTPALDKETKILTDYFDKLSANPKHHILYIRQARVKEVKDGKAVVNWALSPLLDNTNEVDKSLMAMLEHMGGDIRVGTAPADPMERQLQKDIEKLAEKAGKGRSKGHKD